MSKNTELTALYCENNQLTNLIVSNNAPLKELSCGNNQLSTTALNTLFNSLNNNAVDKVMWIGGNPGTDYCTLSIAKDKGWTVYK